MSIAMLFNVHQRRGAARPEQVWDLLMTMSSPDDRLWPSGIPAPRLDGPLAVGAHGGHGPIRYQLTSLDETTGMVFRFQKPIQPHHHLGRPRRHRRTAGRGEALMGHRPPTHVQSTSTVPRIRRTS